MFMQNHAVRYCTIKAWTIGISDPEILDPPPWTGTLMREQHTSFPPEGAIRVQLPGNYSTPRRYPEFHFTPVIYPCGHGAVQRYRTKHKAPG